MKLRQSLRLIAGLLIISIASPAFLYAGVVLSGSGGGGMSFSVASGGSANRVLFTDGSGVLTDDADLTFVTDTLTATNITMGAVVAESPKLRLYPGVDYGFGVNSNRMLYYSGGSAASVHSFMIASGNTPIFDIGSPFSILGNNAGVASPTSRGIQAEPGLGTDKTGGSLTLSGGLGTGSGISGDVAIGTSVPLATSATLQTYGDRFRIISKYVTLTESTATSFARIAIPSGTVSGGDITVTAEANNGTDFQARTLRATWSAVNKAGAITAGINTPDEAIAVSSGTLTCTLTLVDATGNNLDFKNNCVSSLTQTVLRATSIITKNFGTGAISAQ